MRSLNIIILLLINTISLCAQNISFLPHQIYQTSQRLYFVSTADMNNDLKKDIFISEPANSSLRWFKNEGNGNFNIHTIGDFSRCTSVFVCDFDSDGDQDVFASSYDSSKVVLFENIGNDVFNYHLISDSVIHPLVIVAKDIDGDNDIDIACATQDAGTGIVLLINNGNFIFNRNILSLISHTSTWVKIIDFDKDGDMDIIGNHFNSNGGILWYEQVNDFQFTEHTIPCPSVHGFTVADLDNDHDLDIATVSCGSQVDWFKNEGSNIFTKINLINNYNCAVSIEAGDVNNDPYIDLIASAWSGNKIGYWQNSYNQNFTYQTITDTFIQANSVFIDDINADGFKDIIAVSYSGKLIWWENCSGNFIKETNISNSFASINYEADTGNIEIVISSVIKFPLKLTIYNSLGQIHSTLLIESNKKTINCKSFAKGTYIFSLQSENKSQTSKIIIR